ncbi:fructose-1,6-bisphosphatase [Dorea acetigenes]|uniref:Fructose-1,6-bisphosphatase class 3 n=1 Tax=Dorea acetigenes TaxID=2981787 RepID=A0ABT2RJ43_9FIRM|nr:fructose-1,6-bisphosphatase [Dorea acetigenes]MCU6685219.1 fructose-1,6-bisphosphatase [Dorea acetigenes]SCI40627.1 Fructose-1%2C6-bisphosphatase class 3 [uncultured Clostridium sp.]
MEDLKFKYLERLSEIYPTIAQASTEVINLQAILNLPKGTEHFLTDIHGEYEAFAHVLKNGSGSVRRKVDAVFGNTMSSRDKQALATLIYYPREKMDRVKKEENNMEDWYKITLYRLIEVCKRTASKYTRSKVRKALPKDFAYVIEELITEKAELTDKESYYNEIVNTIIRVRRAEEFIIALSELIQRLTVDHLHIVGDIYDRGPGPHIIMDKLMQYHSVDIQWGNHDILWMGAAAGQRGCIANVIRICARYGNLDILEDGYGINLLPLATFALSKYADDPCECFGLKGSTSFTAQEKEMEIKMHKAISIIQFKVEGQIIRKNPGFKMEGRNLLHRIDFEKGTIDLDGQKYELLDKNFPTIDPRHPYTLTKEEEDIMERLERAFLNCEKLQEHMRFLLNKGGLYKVYNNNLLYHGCIPLNEDGSMKQVKIYGKTYKGKELYEVLESYVRKGFFAVETKEKERGRDMMWYIWLNENSPLFGKDKMATFERYFLAEKETHLEKKNPYYSLLENEKVVDSILAEFGLSGECIHIVNGHVPVRSKNGESPIKCGGKVLVIDGGFSKAYQKETGIAGYTLIYNSYGLILTAHDPFESTEAAIEKGSDIHSDSIIVKRVMARKRVEDTDDGKRLKERIRDLEFLLEAYRSGRITEKI